jgi:serine/threonine protein kinase
MAPEQIRGGSVGPATDLYALGATLFELLCGRPPFEGSSCGQTLTLQLSAIPPRVRDLRQDIPGRLERVVAIALAKEPDRRFRSASAMRAALLASLESPRTTAAGRSAWREPLTAALAIVALLVALHVAFEAPQGDDPDTTVMQDLVEFR